MTASLYTRALNLVHRLTGREAAALRYQRDAHAEEAGRERLARMEAERDRNDWREHSTRGWEERNIHVARGNEYLRQKNEQYARFEARGETIRKLQNRLTRWQRRYRRAMVALHTRKPEAQAWKRALMDLRTAFAATTRAITLSMAPGDDIHRQVTDRAIDAAAAAMRAENPAMHLDVAAVCARLREGSNALAEASKWETSAMCEASRREEAERERETFRTALQTTIGVAKQWEQDYDAVCNALQACRCEAQKARAEEYERALRECLAAREQKASEHLCTLREMTGMAAQVKRELDAATALIERLVAVRDEHALAEAATWLHTRAAVRGATEQEGSRGGLAWMPGEALPDE